MIPLTLMEVTGLGYGRIGAGREDLLGGKGGSLAEDLGGGGGSWARLWVAEMPRSLSSKVLLGVKGVEPATGRNLMGELDGVTNF